MNWETYLDELSHLGIALWPDGDDLLVEGPSEALTAAHLQTLKTHKHDLLHFLRHATTQYPLSAGQQGLWFEHQMMPEGFAYNASLPLRIHSVVASSLLQQAFQLLVNRHAALRTTFPLVEGQPIQQVKYYQEVQLAQIDASQWSEQYLKERVRAAHESPFDLAQGPLFRLSLFTRQADEHVFLFTVHHLIFDGWSNWLLFDELRTVLTALLADEPAELPALESSYRDYVGWQARVLQEKEEQLWGYWRNRLAGELPLLNLPTDRLRPAVRTYQGASLPLEIPPHLTVAVTTLARRSGVTLYMVLLAAFQILLQRYTGQDDILVGSPIVGRSRPEFDSTIGYFVNPVVMRANLAANLSVREFIAQVRQTVLGALGHQDFPFPLLVQRLQPARAAGVSPLFQAMFALQKAHTEPRFIELVTAATTKPMDIGGLQLSSFPLPQFEGLFDLYLQLFHTPTALMGAFKYNPDIFDTCTIKRMAGHFQILLEGIVTNLETPISDLPILTPAERQQLLVEWNNTATDYHSDKCVHHLFEAQVERTPDAIAVIFGEDQLTYRELNQRANQLAHHLIELGVGPEVLVGICVERSIAMIVGLLGILKAGGAYVPLDPDYPQERLQFMLQDAKISLLLIQYPLQERLALTARIVYLDGNRTPSDQHSDENVSVSMSPDNLAYVIYTSGSTGMPKGVLVQHNNVVRLLTATQAWFYFNDRDVWTLFHSYAFDFSVWEIWGALLYGGRLVVVPYMVSRSPDLFYQLLCEQGVTVLNQTPSAFTQLIQAEESMAERDILPENLVLRTVIFGGEALNFASLQPWFSRHDDQSPRLINMYGITETTVHVTYRPITRADLTQQASLIGSPIPDLQLYILDAHQQLVPIGVSGELYVGGAGVSRGYLHRPQLTAERFITLDSLGNGNQRVYRTGDLVRRLPESCAGEIEYLGRIDNQVKIRGFRIELGEIETTLTRHPNIQDAVVVAREDNNPLNPNSKQLVSYLVAGHIDSATQAEHVEEWRSLYEETYGQAPSQKDLSFNLSGWNSSYTGQPIPEPEMAEWVEQTIADIRRLQPKRVLEIGCGTGLLLSQLAPDCDVYWGTDYSQHAIDHIEQLKAVTPNLGHVYLNQRTADDFTGIAEHQFDCVILNSIVQYFPSVEYLLNVLEGAVRAVGTGGKIYVGDVRNLRLLAAYHVAVQTYQAADDLPLTELQTRIQLRLRDEEELLIEPDFFYALPKHLSRIAQVEIQLKRGLYVNELTQFRYQVVLHVVETDSRHVDRQQIVWQEEDWQQQAWSVSTLEKRLHDVIQASPERGIVIRNIPNSRVQNAIQTLEIIEQRSTEQIEMSNVEQLRTHLAQQNEHLHPESLWVLSKTCPYTVCVTWSRSPGLMDAFFVPTALIQGVWRARQLERMPKPWRDYTNNPLLGKLNRRLVPKVRTWLAQRLPDYMIPSAFVMLDAFPLTPNGKVDRKALPAPSGLIQVDDENFVPPSTSTEIAITNIWLEVLGIERIGIEDNFFELGGHSLLATQVVSRLRDRFSVELPLRTFFEKATVSTLAKQIEALCAVQDILAYNDTEFDQEEVEW
jgi:amino acid adenylation domain-containing protein